MSKTIQASLLTLAATLPTTKPAELASSPPSSVDIVSRRFKTAGDALKSLRRNPENYGATAAHLKQIDKDIAKVRERQVEDEGRAARRKEQPTLQDGE